MNNQEIINEYNSGKSGVKLATELNVSYGEYIKKNYTYEQISCKLGIKLPTVGFIARKVKHEN